MGNFTSQLTECLDYFFVYTVETQVHLHLIINKSHSVLDLQVCSLIDSRRHHKMFKTASGTMSVMSCFTAQFGHFMASSVVSKRTDNGKLYVISFLPQT